MSMRAAPCTTVVLAEAPTSVPERPLAFLLGYVGRRRGQFTLLFALVSAAAGRAVGVQYGMKFGRPGASDAEMRAAARLAGCDDFIMALPDGYDALVGERGARLSGGQRQRIGIARAFLKDAPILLLDEATSALDSGAEAEVQRALSTLMHGRTVIAVAHRLATVVGFDRVVVLVGGRVVEDGPPADLRRRGGVFSGMWRLQAEGFSSSFE